MFLSNNLPKLTAALRDKEPGRGGRRKGFSRRKAGVRLKTLTVGVSAGTSSLAH